MYRQAPLNSIWEGSGNIQCLDVLRALAREPETGEALRAEIEAARGLHPAFDKAARSLGDLLAGASEAGARRLAERLALALQASALLRAGSPVAEAFCRTRLDGDHGLALGTLPVGLDHKSIMSRALPG